MVVVSEVVAEALRVGLASDAEATKTLLEYARSAHDIEWRSRREGMPEHAMGERPEQCAACAAWKSLKSKGVV